MLRQASKCNKTSFQYDTYIIIGVSEASVSWKELIRNVNLQMGKRIIFRIYWLKNYYEALYFITIFRHVNIQSYYKEIFGC